MIKKAGFVSTMAIASMFMMVSPVLAAKPEVPNGPNQHACDNNANKEHGQTGPYHAEEVGGFVHCDGGGVPV